MDTYADDLAELIEALDLHDAVLVGHSTGGGEVARYLGRHGSDRVTKAVLVAAVPPLKDRSQDVISTSPPQRQTAARAAPAALRLHGHPLEGNLARAIGR
jgi:non-heme chloroperoxidase